MTKVLCAILLILLLPVTSSYSGEPDRFKDNGDGTITDTSTGLMWGKVTEPVLMTWSYAADHVKTYKTGKYTDWRLPTQDELWSLHKGMSMNDNPSEVLKKYGFDIKPFYYWSSSTCKNPGCKDTPMLKCSRDDNCFMCVSMEDYSVVGQNIFEKMLLLPVRNVKGKIK